MRDLRFRDSEQWRAQMLAAQKSAEDGALVVIGTDRAHLLAALEIVLACGDVSSIAFAGAALPSFVRIAADVEGFLTFGSNVRPIVWLLIAQALASSAVRATPDPARIEHARARLDHAMPWVLHAFEEACAVIIETTEPDRREAWLNALARPLTVVEPRENTATGPVQVVATQAKWSLGDVFELWADDNVAIVLVAGHAPTALLCRLDVDRWFRAVDRWDDGRLVAGALFGDPVLHDRELLISFLKTAAPVFDQDGAWTGRAAAVLLAEQAVDHGHALLRAIAQSTDCDDDTLAAVRDVELAEFFGSVWNILLARSDGLRIASALHAHLTSVEINLTDGARRTDATASARSSLATALAAHGATTSQLRALRSERVLLREKGNRGAGSRHAVAVFVILSALEVAERSNVDAHELLSFVCDHVGAGDREWKWLPARTLARTIERLVAVWLKRADAVPRLENLYDSLEAARRRAERSPHADATDATLLGSSLALVLLLATADDVGCDASTNERSTRRALRLALTSEWAFEPVLTPSTLVGYALILLARSSPDRVAHYLRVVLNDVSLGGLVVTILLSKMSREDVEMHLRACGTSLGDVHRAVSKFAEHTKLPPAIKVAQALEASEPRDHDA